MFLAIKLCTYTKLFEIELFICIKMDFALNNLQGLICHKTQTNKQIVFFLSSLNPLLLWQTKKKIASEWCKK